MLTFREATTELTDAEIVRTLRNSGRQWMTRDPRELSQAEQAQFWARRSVLECPIWIAQIATTPIGYGLLRREKDRWWCSLAVAPRYRGMGFGRQIYQYLAHATNQDVYAEILADNTPSIRACLGAGYQIAYAMDKHAVLVYRKEL